MNRGNQLDFVGYDPSTDEAYLIYDREKDYSLPIAIVKGIAALTGEQAEEIPPLHSVVNPDALDALFEPLAEENERPLGKVSFEYYGFEISVYASDVICINTSRADFDSDHPRS
ncbi:HalOD1 output domain-containing protein [Natrarchaeobius oligotrophus]|uniref:HalOD1 output domain-containing protein n=1 Tax=Natrarchaeobius oligotrophus TaxID=3455743 RepID=UPI000F52AAF5|nr:HalOD1 output domain-containing protein [Natrarchaeobius chitinivorans]